MMVSRQSSLPALSGDTRFTIGRPAHFPEILLETNSFDNFCAMKIHADKIEEGPPHALNRRDVRLIFKTVPPD